MSTRTQIYLSERQRRHLDELCKREGKALAQVIREAVDSYFVARRDPAGALDETFGVAPGLEVPSRDEWSRRG